METFHSLRFSNGKCDMCYKDQRRTVAFLFSRSNGREEKLLISQLGQVFKGYKQTITNKRTKPRAENTFINNLQYYFYSINPTNLLRKRCQHSISSSGTAAPDSLKRGRETLNRDFERV